jgi:hypothetical protein
VVRVLEVFDVLGPAPTGKRTRELIFGPADVGRTLLRGSGIDWTYPDPTPDGRGVPVAWMLHKPLHLGPLRPVLPVVPNGEPRR